MTKEVKRNRETGDFDMYLSGQYIGSRETPQAARAALDRVALEQLRRAS